MPRRKSRGWVVVACLLMLAADAGAELKSGELLLVYNANSPTSQELAEYYAQRRAVPSEQLIGLDLPLVEDMLRTDYDQKMVRPLRRYLWDSKLATKVRCLVTFYDVPLRVGPRLLTEAEQKRMDWVRWRRDEYLAEIHQVINEVHALAEGVDPQRKANIKRKQIAEEELRMAFAYYRKILSRRVGGLEDEQEAARVRMRFLALAVKIDGMRGAGGQVTADGHLADQAVLDRLAELRQHTEASEEELTPLLEKGLMSEDYPRAIEGLTRWGGLASAFGRLDHDQQSMDFTRSDAAVDSELTLLWWRPYKLVNMLFNWLSCRAKMYSLGDDDVPRKIYGEVTLMTCRLDGPTPEVVRRMIDDAIAVEKKGLSGTAYVDRDPMRQTRKHMWQVQALTGLTDLLTGKTTFPLVVERTQDLFDPGACPHAALYCGWYSLMEYVDAFEFVPGAVAYHIASGEAISLRDPTATYWCKEILSHGAAATLGAVAEPFLRGIPRPDEFFGLLMTGQYTLAEVFALTNHYVSWRVIVLGDPLYNPFKVNPQLVLEDVLTERMLPLDHRPERFRPLPKGPEDLQPWGPGIPGYGRH